MKFKFSNSLIEGYERDGYAVFREILPTSLIADLRRATDQGRELVRKTGEKDRQPVANQIQRFQPIAKYDIDQKPFEAFRDLPELRDAVQRLLSPQHTYGNPRTYLGVFIEPQTTPYCTAWHQDWRHFHPPSRPGLTLEAKRDKALFNQINCPLYRDDCTWVVPGSYARDDTPAERAAFSEDIPTTPPLDGKTNEERERICLDYCRRMPGAQRLHLDPGDFVVYRNTLWHMGNYVPYMKRATILDLLDSPGFLAWRKKFAFLLKEEKEVA
jgi:ectoine hydroxylase-related dioxygenase (phytanoyl-CoA dioxygenase family)